MQWRAQEYTWAGGERVNRALRERQAGDLAALVAQTPSLLVRPFLYDDPQHPPAIKATLAHACVHMDWHQGVEALHAAGENFQRVPAAGNGRIQATTQTAAGYAVLLGRTQILERLLDWGCCPDGTPGQPLASLLVGVGNDQARLAISRLLARHGARLDATVEPEQGQSGHLLAWLVRHNQPLVVLSLLERTPPAQALLEDPLLHHHLAFALFRSLTHAWPKTTLEQDLQQNFQLVDALVQHGMPPLDPLAMIEHAEGLDVRRQGRAAARHASIVRYMMERYDYPAHIRENALQALTHVGYAPGSVPWLDAFMAQEQARILQSQQEPAHHPGAARPRL